MLLTLFAFFTLGKQHKRWMMNVCMADTTVYRTMWPPDKIVFYFHYSWSLNKIRVFIDTEIFSHHITMPFGSQKSCLLFRPSRRIRSFGGNHHRGESQLSSTNRAWNVILKDNTFKENWYSPQIFNIFFIIVLKYKREIVGNRFGMVRKTQCVGATPLFVCVKTSTCRSLRLKYQWI